ncbi:sigma-54-dependent transcriptional regulator [Tenacibaculum sp. M341]|uniref:sigma-54-dependent transcriptional regulator n=1 Tax=Tenacibaculum sp. M341 TaxID=2530339 RepID=UPI0010487AC8|nr:sigma-54 dependent transcriptional regulator [Tenacibaculum sp. M341]TCI84595.1 sigma-54-dependent Fis family transcriptional regulator [Tenacibaculum sp. M341]
MHSGKILIIDDNKSVISALEIMLQSEYETVVSISNPNQISSFPNLKSYDVILLDMNFSAGVNTGNEGLFWLRKIKDFSPDSAVIMMTAYGDIELAVKALREQAYDFILKPWNNEKLLTMVKSAMELRRSKAEIHNLKNKTAQLKKIITQQDHQPIIGSSPVLLEVIHLIDKVASTEVNVLITGENGTGKEMIAKALHSKSNRKNEVFISVDMGSISENLFESELFGHLKGSFTDAKEDRIGKFEAAEGGTLFLDEIGNLSLSMQAKLLSAIQNKTIVKVGSNTPMPVDIRLVCATNCNLEQMVSEGSFREDLLYRINTIHVNTPPLRQRDNDIISLAQHFLDTLASKYNKPPFSLNEKAKAKLIEHSWPGNVRELKHTMERAVILSDSSILTPENFMVNPIKKVTTDSNTIHTLEEMEHDMISKALLQSSGNFTEAAIMLGITRQTLYNKVKKMKANDK